jgi:UDP:flavonoid glycosyltransferase YjiC (YdhE family)
MSRILIACWGSFGDVYPYVGLGRALAGRGHHVRLALPEFYRSAVEIEGLDFHSTPPQVDPQERDLIRRVMDRVKGPEVIVREWVVPALRESYAALDVAACDVDLIVSHPVTFAAPVLAEKRGLPWVSTLLAPASFMSASDFPVIAAALRLTSLQRFVPGAGMALRSLVRGATDRWMEPVRALRFDLGLTAGQNPILEGQFSPLMTLALFSRVLARPQRDWPPNAHMTGFVFYNGHEALSPELQAFLDAGPPPVVFTLGSSAVGAAGRFYEESAEAVSRLGVRAVLLRGPFPDNEPTRTRSCDVLVIDRAPHQLLFPRAAAIVHQGGAGTTGQALRAGKPTLIVPHAHDQPDNAFRVTRLGVGDTIFPWEYTAERATRALGRLLNSRRYQRNAERVADVVQHEGGADAAAALIETAISESARS